MNTVWDQITAIEATQLHAAVNAGNMTAVKFLITAVKYKISGREKRKKTQKSCSREVSVFRHDPTILVVARTD